MDVSKIPQGAFQRSRKDVGRVIAIRPVAKRGEAARWQKRAIRMTIWVYEPHHVVPTYARILLLRLWYVCRIHYARIQARVHGDAEFGSNSVT